MPLDAPDVSVKRMPMRSRSVIVTSVYQTGSDRVSWPGSTARPHPLEEDGVEVAVAAEGRAVEVEVVEVVVALAATERGLEPPAMSTAAWGLLSSAARRSEGDRRRNALPLRRLEHRWHLRRRRLVPVVVGSVAR